MSNFSLRKFGRNPSIASGPEDIWDGGSNYLFPAVAFETQIVGLANDDVGSDGIHTVQVEGLDINGVEISEVATLTGATPVTLANSFYRVNRMGVLATGANLTNSGNISVSHTGSAELARISPQQGQTLQAIYTMPAGVSGRLVSLHVSAGTPGQIFSVAGTMIIQTKSPGAGWRTKDSLEFGREYAIDRRYQTDGISIGPLDDIRCRVTTVNTTMAISAAFEVDGFRDVR